MSPTAAAAAALRPTNGRCPPGGAAAPTGSNPSRSRPETQCSIHRTVPECENVFRFLSGGRSFLPFKAFSGFFRLSGCFVVNLTKLIVFHLNDPLITSFFVENTCRELEREPVVPLSCRVLLDQRVDP